MKKLPSIAAALLGLAFITFGLNYFLKFMPAGGPMEEGSAGALFFGAIAPTGFLTMVKILEILGGLLVALPKTRNIGLLVLGPIVLNIIAINVFIIGAPCRCICFLFKPLVSHVVKVDTSEPTVRTKQTMPCCNQNDPLLPRQFEYVAYRTLKAVDASWPSRTPPKRD